MSQNTNWGGNLVFFLLGAATGAAVALLYAPQEGEATRRVIVEGAGTVRDKATEATSQVAKNVSEATTQVASQARDKWGELAEKAQGIIKSGQNQANATIDQVAEAAHDTVNGEA